MRKVTLLGVVLNATLMTGCTSPIERLSGEAAPVGVQSRSAAGTSPPSPPSPSTPSLSPSPPSTAPASSKPVSPGPGTTSPPPGTGITAAMMLRPSDVGSGYTVTADTGGDWTFEFNAAALGCPRGFTPDPVAERERTLRKGLPQDENILVQHAGRYPSGQATRYLDGVRERVSSCSPAGLQSVSITAEGFAGDEAVLVTFDHGSGYLTRTVLVRKGDVLTEIWSKPTRSDSANQELGRKAAARF